MKVLAIGAHPDDIEISCSGTLAKCVKRGDEVYACHLSDGDLGHVEIMPKELGKIRVEEAKRAGSVGGVNVIWGGFHDLDIYADNREARDKVAELIRSIRPDFIITHNPTDYMSDHTATSKLVFDAAFAATIPHYPSKYPEPAGVVPIYYMEASSGMDFVPDLFVDITDEMEIKEKMFSCHESQIVWLKDHDNVDYVEKIRIVAQYRGFQCGAKYAESFRVCKVDGRMSTKILLP